MLEYINFTITIKWIKDYYGCIQFDKNLNLNEFIIKILKEWNHFVIVFHYNSRFCSNKNYKKINSDIECIEISIQFKFWYNECISICWIHGELKIKIDSLIYCSATRQ